MKYYIELKVLVDDLNGDHDAYEYGEYLAIDLKESKKSILNAEVRDIESIVDGS